MRKFRAVDVELLSVAHVSLEEKLIYSEIATWHKYYQERGTRYYITISALNRSLGIYIQNIVPVLMKFIDAGVISVEDTIDKLYVNSVMPVEDFVKYLSK